MLRRLILDGVLEVHHNGSFVSGPSASFLLPCEGGTAKRRIVPAADPSLKALASGASLLGAKAGEIAAHLYFYNRLPLTSRWHQLLRTPGDALRYLGLGYRSSTKRSLQREWVIAEQGTGDGWLSWRRASSDPHAAGKVTYKLYVSPLPQAMRETIPHVVEAVTEAGAFALKCGADAYGILRPDKLVAYFHTMREMMHASSRLRVELRGVPPQGVPFASAIDRDGLLSWGVDPPAGNCQTVGESWRGWVTKRLGQHLRVAMLDGASALASQNFALGRLRLDGVNVSEWRLQDTRARPAPA